MFQISAIVIAMLLGATEPPATAAQGTRQLEEVIVEEKVEGDFADFEAWDREVRDGLQRATLKQRDELTAHDHAQILILEKEMPVLKRSLDKIKFLVRAHKFRQTLTHREIEQLSEAYRTAEAILENVPDAFMPRCRQLHKYDGRNKVATCDIDYYAIQKQMDEYARKRASGETKARATRSRPSAARPGAAGPRIPPHQGRELAAAAGGAGTRARAGGLLPHGAAARHLRRRHHAQARGLPRDRHGAAGAGAGARAAPGAAHRHRHEPDFARHAARSSATSRWTRSCCAWSRCRAPRPWATAWSCATTAPSRAPWSPSSTAGATGAAGAHQRAARQRDSGRRAPGDAVRRGRNPARPGLRALRHRFRRRVARQACAGAQAL